MKVITMFRYALNLVPSILDVGLNLDKNSLTKYREGMKRLARGESVYFQNELYTV